MRCKFAKFPCKNNDLHRFPHFKLTRALSACCMICQFRLLSMSVVQRFRLRTICSNESRASGRFPSAFWCIFFIWCDNYWYLCFANAKCSRGKLLIDILAAHKISKQDSDTYVRFRSPTTYFHQPSGCWYFANYLQYCQGFIERRVFHNRRKQGNSL